MSHPAGFPAPSSTRRWSFLLVAVFTVLIATVAMAGAAPAADLNASPSNLSSVYASAQGGDVIHLASGSYGGFGGGSKSSVVTLVAAVRRVGDDQPESGVGREQPAL